MMKSSWGLPALAILLSLFFAAQASAQLQFDSKDGKSSFKVGLLGQLQAESLDNAGGDEAQNLFLRRLRLLMNYKLGDKLTVFLDTDSPNLGKAAANGQKNTGDLFLQDLIVTWTFSKAFQLDGGLLQTPLSFNQQQSAATLVPVDYGNYTFVTSGPLEGRNGRDYGLQARGYLAGDRFEYRLGVFDGARGVGATNDLRFTGRAMWWIRGGQTTFFYRGNSLGKNQSLGVGASYDHQEDYSTLTFDAFLDQPLGNGDGLTLQADYSRIDGGGFINLAKQDDLLLEAGYYLAAAKLQPFLQYAAQDFDDPARPDEEKLQVGLGWFPGGHGSALKLGYGRIERDGSEDVDQIVLQWQVFQF
ncbi:MAG TPA: hypothetical protein VF017_09980 [Thermoanaerobaculia bacterium]|nr:hypothetical protein [Thermoanaerobaculia bacterium]